MFEPIEERNASEQAAITIATMDQNGKDDLKTQFVTREGTYRLITLSEYSRPNRVGYQSNQNNPQVRVSLITLPAADSVVATTNNTSIAATTSTSTAGTSTSNTIANATTENNGSTTSQQQQQQSSYHAVNQ